MKKKTSGIIFVCIGVYFSVINVILSIIFISGFSIGYPINLNPFEYFGHWLIFGGLFVLIFAILGIYLIYIGYNKIREYQH